MSSASFRSIAASRPAVGASPNERGWDSRSRLALSDGIRNFGIGSVPRSMQTNLATQAPKYQKAPRSTEAKAPLIIPGPLKAEIWEAVAIPTHDPSGVGRGGTRPGFRRTDNPAHDRRRTNLHLD
jgi:hypothetical protein